MIKKEKDITIIGIGSFAGGLEAISELVATLPNTLKVAYVVQHISPHHKSLMTKLVARQARLKVKDFKGDAELEPNVI